MLLKAFKIVISMEAIGCFGAACPVAAKMFRNQLESKWLWFRTAFCEGTTEDMGRGTRRY